MRVRRTPSTYPNRGRRDHSLPGPRGHAAPRRLSRRAPVAAGLLGRLGRDRSAVWARVHGQGVGQVRSPFQGPSRPRRALQLHRQEVEVQGWRRDAGRDAKEEPSLPRLLSSQVRQACVQVRLRRSRLGHPHPRIRAGLPAVVRGVGCRVPASAQAGRSPARVRWYPHLAPSRVRRRGCRVRGARLDRMDVRLPERRHGDPDQRRVGTVR